MGLFKGYLEKIEEGKMVMGFQTEPEIPKNKNKQQETLLPKPEDNPGVKHLIQLAEQCDDISNCVKLPPNMSDAEFIAYMSQFIVND